jgi:hypothetical protein
LQRWQQRGVRREAGHAEDFRTAHEQRQPYRRVPAMHRIHAEISSERTGL